MVEQIQSSSHGHDHIPDKVLMYACIFTYEKAKVRNQILNYNINYEAIDHLESKYCQTRSTQIGVSNIPSLAL